MTEAITPLNIIWSILGAIGVAFLGLLVWGIKKLVVTTFENTFAISKLSDKLEKFTEQIELLPKLEKDVGAAHEKIRNIQKGI